MLHTKNYLDLSLNQDNEIILKTNLNFNECEYKVLTFLDGFIKLRNKDGKVFWCKITVDKQLLDTLPDDIPIEKAFLIFAPPVFFKNVDAKVAFLDIETTFNGNINNNDLILCATLWCDGKFYYYGPPLTEKEIVQHILNHDFDIVAGWNLRDFDWAKIKECAKKYGLTIGKVIPIDYDDIVRSSFGKQFKSFKLEDVAQELLGYGKTELDGKYPVELNSEELEIYNMNDVKLLVNMENKFKALRSKLNIQNVAHCFLDDCFNSSMFLDYLIIRESLKRDIKIPSNDYNKEHSFYKGAYVYAKPGVYKNCMMVDVVSLYPSIIIGFNVGPDTLTTQEETNILITPNGRYFKKEPISIYASIERNLWINRMKYKDLMKREINPEKKEQYNIQQNTFKICLNSLYGLTGAPFYRFYEPIIAESITQTGVFIIKMVKEFLEKNNIEIIQVDTDGCIFVLPPDKTQEEMLSNINEMLDNWCKEKNLNWQIKMDLKGIPDTVLVLKKKKYCYRIGNNIEFVGIDAIRSDISEFARSWVLKTTEIILNDGKDINELKEKIAEIKKNIREEIKKVPVDLIAIPKGLQKNLNDYKTKNPWQIGSYLGNVLFNQNITGGSKPKMIYIKPIFYNGEWYDSLSFLDSSKIDWNKITIDYDRMLEQTVFRKIYIMLEPLMSFDIFKYCDLMTLERFF